MRLRSFHGPTLNDAMRQVRETLGDNAIIVSTRDDDAGGIRVTAALDDTPPRYLPKQVVVHDNDAIEELSNHLYRHGFSAQLTEKILATAMQSGSQDNIISLAAALDAHVGFHNALNAATPKPVVLIGPPGVGKTVSAAKIATQAKLKNKPVCVITTDLIRAGGIDQLAAFMRILKLKLLEIEDPVALRDTLAMHGGSTITVVDTAGQNPRNPEERRELKALVQKLDAEVVLTLPAGLDAIDGSELAQAYKDCGATSLLITRIDLVRRLGSILSIAHEAKLPVVGISRSGNVADAIESINPVTLAKLILPDSKEPTSSTGTHA